LLLLLLLSSLLLLLLSEAVGTALLLLLLVADSLVVLLAVVLMVLLLFAVARIVDSAACACISSCSVSCRFCMCSLDSLHWYICSCCSMALQRQDMCISSNA
jgi:hypothetical protein